LTFSAIFSKVSGVVGVEGHIAAVHMDNRYGTGSGKVLEFVDPGRVILGISSSRMSKRIRVGLRDTGADLRYEGRKGEEKFLDCHMSAAPRRQRRTVLAGRSYLGL
jgi:hypothetical protein